MNARDHQVPDDVAGTAEMLRQGRPSLASEELDAVRRRVHGRASARRRPNLAVALCLALGLVFSTAGSGLAVSGLSSGDSAVSAQYPDAPPQTVQPTPQPVAPAQTPAPAPAPTAQPTPTPAPEVLPEEQAEEPEVLAEEEEQVAPAPTLGEEEPPAAAAPAVAEETVVRQVEATGDLPFTGFEAIPVLVAGIALLLVGGLLRRRTGQLPA